MIVLGAVGYGAFKVGGKGVAVAKGGLKKHNGRRFRNGVARAAKKVLKSLGKDTIDLHIAAVSAQIAALGAPAGLLQQRASLCFAAMRYADAQQDLAQLILVEPENLLAHFTKGYIHSLLGESSNAEAHLNIALVRLRLLIVVKIDRRGKS